ncbi:MAG TPA: ABC transporter permease [Solirubrobacteraceae bacterium]
MRRVTTRPELGALGGTVFVFVFFALVAGDRGFLTVDGTINYLEVAAELGILATAVTLLAIGGEFDLSVGSMIGAAGVVMALAVVQLGWPLWLSVVAMFAFAGVVGAGNGYLVVRTGLPSFIVTLAGLFVLRGVTIAITRASTGATEVTGVTDNAPPVIVSLFAGKVGPVPASILWWIALTVVASWVLARTQLGNWIYGTGGDPMAARNMGVPVARVKIILFVLTAMAAALVAAIQVLSTNSADVLRGELKEFQAITATVIGGTLLTGGYGSAIGAAFGALIFGMVSQGIFFTGIDADWFQAFLGAMLLLAVFVNHFTRKRALAGR